MENSPVTRTWLIRSTYLLLITVIGLVTIVGSGGGGFKLVNTPPTILPVDFSPKAAVLNEGGGLIEIDGRVTFSDELDSGDSRNFAYEVIVYDSSDRIVNTVSNPSPDVTWTSIFNYDNGHYLVQMDITVVMDTTIADVYSLSVQITDSGSNKSNRVTSFFTIFAQIQTSSNLPDTGVSRCYDHFFEIPCPDEGENFYGQDAHYVSNLLSFSDNGDGTITDNVTTLMWQQIYDDSVYYNWFEASGTFEATHNPNMIDVCNPLTLGGFNDWRLPTRRELESIVDYGVDSPIFFNTGASFWTLTDEGVNARYVRFFDGLVKMDVKTDGKRVRCVRGNTWGGNAFIENNDGTITDTVSGLMWQDVGQGTGIRWGDMLAVCKNLTEAGYSDWRLPDIRELGTIIGAESAMSINPGVYCSSTTVANMDQYVWLIQLDPTKNYGDVVKAVDGESKDLCQNYYSRCVR